MSVTAPRALLRHLDTEADTLELGAALAQSLPRNAPDALVVFLQGELGSGKTTLARALLRELGEQGTVRSPSYTLIENYELAGWRVLHLDLYRLREPAELEQLALREELRAGVLLLVEWPERALADLPDPDLRIVLSMSTPGPAAGRSDAGQLGRQASIECASAPGERWLAEFKSRTVSRTGQS
jgi:tRNA threonylcarbamoyladenosine biosynthesis protein TsaE